MIKYSDLTYDSAFSSAFVTHKVTWAAVIITLASITTMTGTTLCSLLGQPRILYQMASDRLLMKPFMILNKNRVPYFGTIATGIFSTCLALVLDLDQLSSMISVGTLLAFTLVCGGVVVLRYSDSPVKHQTTQLITLLMMTFASCIFFGIATYMSWGVVFLFMSIIPFIICVAILWWAKPQTAYVDDVFRCPLVPLVPCLGMLFNSVIIVHLELFATVGIIIWAAIGLVIYFSYGIKHSALNFQLASESDRHDIQ